jgi:arylsulfatase A-like enzyme
MITHKYKKNLALIVILTSLSFITIAQNKTTKPNVIVILVDDMGWQDLACFGSKFYETPNIDALAKDGILFTQNYASCPVCSPTRASVLTGKNPVKTGVTDWIKGRQANANAKPFEKLIGPETAYELALAEKTIAEEALKSNYKTFFVGKWHLGEEEKFWPQHQGFQKNIGGWSKGSPSGKINDTTGGFFAPYKNPTISEGVNGEYLTDRLTDETMAFIDKNKTQPFFIMYSSYAVHNPLQAPKTLVDKYLDKQKKLAINSSSRFVKDEPWMKNQNDWKRRTVQDNAVYAAMIENLDWNIGRIITQLKSQNLYYNTLIIFTSDNGGLSTAEGSPTVNANLRGGKGWLYEGGIRVPMIITWKNAIKKPSVSTLPISSVDIYPTVAKAINGSYKKDMKIDGDNIFAMLADTTNFKNREIFWHYPHYSNQGGKPGSVIRKGNFKLIYNYEDESVELFNLLNDESEKQNVASKYEQTTKELKAKLFDWLQKNNATKPVKNTGYKLP